MKKKITEKKIIYENKFSQKISSNIAFQLYQLILYYLIDFLLHYNIFYLSQYL